ncbi:hypothetical protein PROFUN_15154 [Planoprotostelium fungivorum]|uniref:Uncharacterized protein n=1 Tax=Planoprotostelium fungivorum TaxID=1890364 RepID=A0A2P6MXR8_9EUKA|nr:hypothetical protein PROFUN_15154 [Planoprotostelium fungivorum]
MNVFISRGSKILDKPLPLSVIEDCCCAHGLNLIRVRNHPKSASLTMDPSLQRLSGLCNTLQAMARKHTTFRPMAIEGIQDILDRFEDILAAGREPLPVATSQRYRHQEEYGSDEELVSETISVSSAPFRADILEKSSSGELEIITKSSGSSPDMRRPITPTTRTVHRAETSSLGYLFGGSDELKETDLRGSWESNNKSRSASLNNTNPFSSTSSPPSSPGPAYGRFRHNMQSPEEQERLQRKFQAQQLLRNLN